MTASPSKKRSSNSSFFIIFSQYSSKSHLPPLFTKVVLTSSGESSTSGMNVGSTNLEANKPPTSRPCPLNHQPAAFPKLQVLQVTILQRLRSTVDSATIPSAFHSKVWADSLPSMYQCHARRFDTLRTRARDTVPWASYGLVAELNSSSPSP